MSERYYLRAVKEQSKATALKEGENFYNTFKSIKEYISKEKTSLLTLAEISAAKYWIKRIQRKNLKVQNKMLEEDLDCPKQLLEMVLKLSI